MANQHIANYEYIYKVEFTSMCVSGSLKGKETRLIKNFKHI